MTINDLVEDWIEIRSKLQHQLKALDAGEIDGATEATKNRLKKWVDELNALLKEYANTPRA